MGRCGNLSVIYIFDSALKLWEWNIHLSQICCCTFGCLVRMNDWFHRSTVSRSQPLLPCALCQESVDHPDLTNPNICSKHKFCDDCILRAFTFSSSCPACMNEAGLTTAAEENVNENRGECMLNKTDESWYYSLPIWFFQLLQALDIYT